MTNLFETVISLLKKLLQRRNEDVTLLLFDEENPHQQDSYTFIPWNLFLFLGSLNLAVILIIMLFFFLTPFGTMLFNKEDRALRHSVVEISQRVAALQDTLEARDRQLSEIQNVIRSQADTTFDIQATDEWRTVYGEDQQAESGPDQQAITFQTIGSSTQALSSDEILFSDIFSGTVMFPAEPPVDGSLTGNYRPEEGHFGMDIAAREGADVRSIADGIVISSDWSINNGHVLHILHGDGIISVFKHFSEVYLSSGDIVRKGDIIGKVGQTGLLASGPHIHFELWKDGIALDPALYIKLN